MNSTIAILYNIAVKASIILIGAFVLTFFLRRASASSRRFVWILATAGLLALPMLSLWSPALGIRQVWTEPILVLNSTSDVNVVTVSPAPRRAAVPTPAPIPWLQIVWTVGMIGVLARLVAGMTRMQWLARNGRVIEAPPGARELAQRIGVRSEVQYLECPRIAMPMTWGILKPVILLPASRAAWPAERLRLVLAHELIHVEQRDCLIQLLMQIACALYWFHPLMWLGASEFRKERERACDDGVLRLGVDGPEYAGHLLELVRSLQPGERPALAVAMAHQSHLETRLVRLLDAKVNRRKLSRNAAVLAMFLTACAVLPLASMRAQATGSGSITGTVLDPSGAVVPFVTLQFTNADTHTQEVVTGNPAGEYSLKGVPAGHYSVEVSSPGFKVFRKSDVLLGANDNLSLNVNLELGKITETVRVIGKKPATAAVPTPAVQPHRIRVGGNVIAARLVSKVDPTYPEIAQAQGIQGAVLLEAVISKEGSVLSLRVINTVNADLAQAARNAVQQWHYQATLLNGEPVEVLTDITVDFKLQP